MALGVPAASAAVAGAVALATSPVIVLTSVHELRARGQVSERLLLMAAVNSVIAVLALKVLRIVLASDADAGSGDMLAALASALRVVSGSFLLGVAAGFALDRLSPTVRGTPAMPVLVIAMVIIASLLAATWTLSPLLALLVAGMTARARMRHGLTVEPHLGSAGAALNVLLFVSLGVLFNFDGLLALWPTVLAIIAARLAAMALGVGALARASGLSWRQAGALALALQPMSSLAVLLAADGFGWPSQLPGVHEPLLRSLLVAVTLMQLTGPIWTEWSLRRVGGEGPPG
jgi:Kef-type K+ transport system membrane component KefB